MKKREKKPPSKRVSKNLNKTLSAVLFSLILTLIAWTTHSVNAVHFPDSGVISEIYGNDSRDDLRQMYRSAILSAKSSVLLLVYTLTDETIISALKEKSLQGVNVKVIVDAKASPGSAERLGKQVETIRRFGKGIMHCKILVVDEELILLGSANMTGDSLRLHSNLVLGINSAAMAAYILEKSASLQETGKAGHYPCQSFTAGGQNLELWFLPDDSLNALHRLKHLIRSSETSINIAMFTWTRMDLAQEVVRAANRGIKVQIAIDSNQAKGACSSLVRYLIDQGIDVRFNTGSGLLHHKYMCIDDKILTIGSANWTKKAFSDNDDCFVIIEDLSSEQLKKINEDWHEMYSKTSLNPVFTNR